MMLVRMRTLGEFQHGDWHILRASLRPLCAHPIYSDRLRDELQVAEIDYARVLGSLMVCGVCLLMLLRAIEDATQACQHIECFMTNECSCIASALTPKGQTHDHP